MAEWFLYIPQSRMGLEDLVVRAQAAEAAGFDGVAFLDHLETPMAPASPIWEAMTVATWVAAKTEHVKLGHLVLCDAFRHPAVLAKQATTLAEASGGRFELGLGSGSMADELEKFDISTASPRERVDALGRTLASLQDYWSDGGDVAQVPTPTHPIPIVLGGVGPRMLDLVRRYADWWNLPATLRPPAAGVPAEDRVGASLRTADGGLRPARSGRRYRHRQGTPPLRSPGFRTRMR